MREFPNIDYDKWFQMTKPLKSREECQSIIDPLEKYNAKYLVDSHEGLFAVFIPAEVHAKNCYLDGKSPYIDVGLTSQKARGELS